PVELFRRLPLVPLFGALTRERRILPALARPRAGDLLVPVDEAARHRSVSFPLRVLPAARLRRRLRRELPLRPAVGRRARPGALVGLLGATGRRDRLPAIRDRLVPLEVVRHTGYLCPHG